MHRNTFLEKFQDILQIDTPLSFDSLLELMEEWDSLTMMSAAAFLHSHFGLSLELADFKKFKTLEDIAVKAGI